MLLAENESGSNAGLDVATIQEFDSLDRNRDGGLNQLEFLFTEVAQRANDHGGRDAAENAFRQIDSNEDEQIELLELAQSQQNRNTRLIDRSSNRKFAGFDANQDGLIALNEYLQRPGAKAEAFDKIDLNDSGTIGPVEWMQALRGGPKSTGSKTEPSFAQLDANDNGAIDRAEFTVGRPPKKIANSFEAVDLNGNQEIGPREFAKALFSPANLAKIPAQVVEEFEELDRNRDQAISRREFERFEALRRPSDEKVDHIFAFIDSNGDQEIGLQEFFQHRERHSMKGKGPPGRGMKGKGKGGR